MTLPTWYDTGTASVANGSTTVAGVGSLWGDDTIMAGDLFCDPAQPMVPPQRIEAVTGNGALTLAAPWPGTSMAGKVYEIRYVGIIERSTATNRRTLELLAGRAFFDPDATGTLVQRANYDTEAKGFSFLNIATDPMTLYIKASDADADWSAGVTFGRGDAGSTGSTGAKGDKGDTGNTGAAGADGRDPGILLTWSTTTTDADPGNGVIRANNASLASATTLFVDNVNRAGSSIAAYLAGLASSTSPIKGTLVLTSTTNTQATFNVTGVTVATGYVKVAVSGHSGATAFTNASAVSFQFSRTGNAGAGSGDVTGAASSTADRIATFTDTSGKAIKDSGKSLSDFYERSVVDAKVLAAQDPIDRVAAVPSLDLVMSGPGAMLPEWFTRASTGTYFDNAGVLRTAAVNEPRYEYDPVTGQCLGLLREDLGTNLLLGSGAITAANGFTTLNCTTTGAVAVAPDKQMAASRIDWSGTTTTDRIYRGVGSLTAGTAYTVSVWMWGAVGGEKVRLSGYDTSGYIIGPVITLSKTPTRYNFTFTPAASGSSFWAIVTGAAVGGIQSTFAWGGQFEANNSASSYIETTTVQRTRAADVCSVPTEAWFSYGSGTLFLWVSDPTPAPFASTKYYLGLSIGGSITEYIGIGGASGTSDVGLRTSAGSSGVLTKPSGSSKMAAAYDGSVLAFSKDGVLASQGSQGSLFSQVTRLDLGTLGNSASFSINGYIRRVTFFPARLSNTELQALTA